MKKKDRYLAEKVRDFKGKKVLCGGTTATIISRELQLPLQVSMDITDKELPPTLLYGRNRPDHGRDSDLK